MGVKRNCKYGISSEDGRSFVTDESGTPYIFCFVPVGEDSKGKKLWCKLNPMTEKVVSYVAYRLIMANGKQIFVKAQ